MTTHQQKFLERVVLPNLSVNSGVYAAVDAKLSMQLNARGEYEYTGLDGALPSFAKEFLQISAFGEEAPSESEIARELFADEPGVQIDSIAGHYTGVFAGWACDESVRLNASSGGITTWLLLELLRLGKIDGVIHMKHGGVGGALFEYQVSRTEEEIRAGAKTRYYPGQLSAVLKEIRQLEGKFALVAIPSIVYEVRLLQRLDSSYKDRISLIIGLICGHQKTANYAEYLGWKMGVAPGNLQSIDFRRKIEGMPANSYSTEVTGVIDGQLQTKVAKQNELSGTDWGLGFFKSNFSDFTEDALNECADLVVGDAWLSKYTADSRGTNIILTRSSSLLKILESGNQRGDIHLETLTVGDLLRSQTSLIRQNVEEIGYRFTYLQRKGWRVPYRLRRASPERIALLRKAIQRARFKTSQTSHIAYLKARGQGDLQVFDETMRPLTKNYRRIQRLTKVRNKLSRRL